MTVITWDIIYSVWNGQFSYFSFFQYRFFYRFLFRITLVLKDTFIRFVFNMQVDSYWEILVSKAVNRCSYVPWCINSISMFFFIKTLFATSLRINIFMSWYIWFLRNLPSYRLVSIIYIKYFYWEVIFHTSQNRNYFFFVCIQLKYKKEYHVDLNKKISYCFSV